MGLLRFFKRFFRRKRGDKDSCQPTAGADAPLPPGALIATKAEIQTPVETSTHASTPETNSQELGELTSTSHFAFWDSENTPYTQLARSKINCGATIQHAHGIGVTVDRSGDKSAFQHVESGGQKSPLTQTIAVTDSFTPRAPSLTTNPHDLVALSLHLTPFAQRVEKQLALEAAGGAASHSFSAHCNSASEQPRLLGKENRCSNQHRPVLESAATNASMLTQTPKAVCAATNVSSKTPQVAGGRTSGRFTEERAIVPRHTPFADRVERELLAEAKSRDSLRNSNIHPRQLEAK